MLKQQLTVTNPSYQSLNDEMLNGFIQNFQLIGNDEAAVSGYGSSGKLPEQDDRRQDLGVFDELAHFPQIERTSLPQSSVVQSQQTLQTGVVDSREAVLNLLATFVQTDFEQQLFPKLQQETNTDQLESLLTSGQSASPPPTLKQDVSWNCDNDNGSPNNYYIPDLRDYLASPSDYDHADEYENDLVQLQFNWILGFSDSEEGHVPPSVPYYKIDLAFGGDGIIKLWDSPAKQNQLTTNSESWVPGSLENGIWAEGINPSLTESDISVTVHTKVVFPNMGGHTDYANTYPTQVTVTPVVQKYEYERGFVPNTNLPPDGVWVLKPDITIKSFNPTKYEIYGKFNIEAILKPAAIGVNKFAQFEYAEDNKLFGNFENYAVEGKKANNETEQWRLGISESVLNSATIVKKSYPFVDSEEGSATFPFYPTNTSDLEKPAIEAGYERLFMKDTPGEKVDLGHNTANGRTAIIWTKTDFEFKFRTYIGIYAGDGNNANNQKIYQPLRYVECTLRYKFKRNAVTDEAMVDDGSSRTYTANATIVKELASGEKLERATAAEKVWRYEI